VADGDYEVYVFSMDRAGNSFATSSPLSGWTRGGRVEHQAG
jgi:hypothetical protein